MINSFINSFICDDCLNFMRGLPDNSIDYVVTSPPYNLRNSTGGWFKEKRACKGRWTKSDLKLGYNSHDDNMPHEEYVAWQRACLSEMLRLIKDTGAIFYNHKWRVQNGLLQDRYDIVKDFPVRQIIIWKRNGGVNFNQGYFLPVFEVIYLIAKLKFRLRPHANGYGDVWEFSAARSNDHPAPFPLALVERIMTSIPSGIIMDPFSGSGTTAIAATKMAFPFICVDKDSLYIEASKKRLESFKAEVLI